MRERDAARAKTEQKKQADAKKQAAQDQVIAEAHEQQLHDQL